MLLSEEQSIQLEAQFNECKQLQVDITSHIGNIDLMMQDVVKLRTHQNKVFALKQDIAFRTMRLRAELTEVEKAYDSKLAEAARNVDAKVFRSEAERKLQAEQQLLGSPEKAQFELLAHKQLVSEALIKLASDTYDNLDKARRDIRTLVDLLKIKHNLVESETES